MLGVGIDGAGVMLDTGRYVGTHGLQSNMF